MKIKPIIFNSEMIRALLDGRKTQHREPIKLTDSGRVKAAGSHRNWHLADPDAVLACPYGQPGDLLWVRERFGFSRQDDDINGRERVIFYRAGGVHITDAGVDALKRCRSGELMQPNHFVFQPSRWRRSIHMPRWASRLTLEITDVRVQRVREISNEDARAEGCEKIPGVPIHPRDWFRGLWDSTNAKRGFGWDANPWVWAPTFKVHRCNVDQVAEIRE